MLRVAVYTGLVALGPALGSPGDRGRGQPGTHHQENMAFDGFPSYDRLPYDARIPAMIRSADTAEDRQGGGGGGFSAPSFNIPFQPNFAFSEFSSPFGSDGAFSQFLSGLGAPGQLGQASPFLQQTEQRLNRPQASSQFKRQTESYSPGRQTAGRARPLDRRPEPVYRPAAQHHLPPAQPYRRQETEERRERVQPVYRAASPARPEGREAAQGSWPAPEGFPKPDFPQMDFNLDFEPAKFQAQAKHMQENRRVQQDNRRPDQETRRVPQEKRRPQQEKMRPQQETRRTQQDNRRQQQNLRAQQEIRAQMELGAEQAMRAEQEMERIQAEQERQEMRREQVQERHVEFSPPSLVEKFQQPVLKSEPYPFPSFPASTPAPAKPEPEQAKPVVTKKPVFQYEKKNFREPVKAGARENLAHPLIRIRPKQQSASPRPALSKQVRPQAGGFQPFRPAHVANPSPGKMDVMEVGRQGEPIVFDNDQEIIMAPAIVKNRNKNNFSINVKSSFGAAGSRRPVQGRRRSIHLPRAVPPAARPLFRAVRQKRQRSIDLEPMVPFFDSERV